MKSAQQQLREAGIYATPQRLAVAEVLFARYRHLTADQIFLEVNRSRETVSRATVYNTLSLFSEKSLIREICVDATRTFYDSNTSHHFHYYDVESQKLSDMETDVAAELLADKLPDHVALEGIELVVRINDPNRSPLS